MNSSSIAGMRILVTGAGGFLGSEISRQLLHEGCVVTGVGRGNYPDLIAAGIDMRRCDIRDSQELSAIASSHDAVIHTAAIAGVWGPWKQFYSINVEGTENVIRCCQEHGISKLIFTSSPSVTFDGGDQQNIRENVEYPSKWLAHYPHTKAIAEKAVLAANNATLATVALRPHLIWGPGDPHLIPRVLERGKRRRLKIIGDGDNKVDMVYVENAALAHICALKSLTANSAISGKSNCSSSFSIA